MQEKKFTNVNFTKRFRELVENSAMTQKELAQALGISEGAIVNYKKDRTPKAEELIAISSYFGVTVDWLLIGSEQPSGSVEPWRQRAMVAEQKLDALKAAMSSWLKKI